MMTKRNRFVVACLISIFGATTLFANNQKGIEYYRGNMVETAKIHFNSQLPTTSDTDKPEAYYYLGLICLDQNKIDSAAYYFDKSLEINTEYPFAYVGKGHIALINNNKKAAEDLFAQAVKIDKKNSNILVEIALVYAKTKSYSDANIQIEKARKINTKNPWLYVAEGDILLMQGPEKA